MGIRQDYAAYSRQQIRLKSIIFKLQINFQPWQESKLTLSYVTNNTLCVFIKFHFSPECLYELLQRSAKKLYVKIPACGSLFLLIETNSVNICEGWVSRLCLSFSLEMRFHTLKKNLKIWMSLWVCLIIWHWYSWDET